MPVELNLPNYLLVQIALLLLGFVYLLWKPKRKDGFKLKFGKTVQVADKTESPQHNLVQFRGKSQQLRSLQVFFNYNGHTFEAYETLGVPAGASLATVEKAFRTHPLLQSAESRAFLEAAYQALNASLNIKEN